MAKTIVKKRWEIQKLLMLIQLILAPVLGLVILCVRGLQALPPLQICTVGLDIAGMLILLILFFNSVKDQADNSLRTGCFTYLLSLTSFALLLDLACWCVNGLPGLKTANLLVNTGYHASGAFSAIIFWQYLVEISESEHPKLPLMTRILNLFCLFSVLVLLGNLIGHYYFSIDADGFYTREGLFLLSEFYLAVMLVCFLLLITRMGIRRNKKLALCSFIIIPIIGMVISNLFYGLCIVYFCEVLALIVIYGNVFSEQAHELTLQKVDNLQKEREILLARQETQRLETELNLASDIQTHVIPMCFPPFPDRKEIDLHATMRPAKEVGGDFYDFFLVDRDHLMLVIADVSGKGIPAALYMMTAKTLIKNIAMQGKSPGEIFEIVNNQLCDGIDEVQMFVTVWLGLVDLRTGRMTACNAGHTYPAIRKKGGRFELLKDKHGLVLGCVEDMPYTEYELQFDPEDTLFVYTDGVTEAITPLEVPFETDNMLRALNRDPAAGPEALLTAVQEEIDDFVDGADQFDDITMLAFRRRKAEE